MKKFMICLIIITLLAGCSAAIKEGEPTSVIFERGHGSMWGEQFYIEVNPNEIAGVDYIDKETMELKHAEHIPITEEQWKEIAFALNDIEPELIEDKPTLLQRLLNRSKLDGGLYRKLTLVYEDSTITYKWPQSDKANELEKIFEKLWA